MASTPEQVVCTPTFVFPTGFPVNGFQLWKEEPKGDVLTFCNTSNPWADYGMRGFDHRSPFNIHVAAQSQPLHHPEDSSKVKGANRGGIKNHLNQNDFTATRNLLVAAASAPPAFPGIEATLKMPNPNLDKQPPQQQQQQQQPQNQHQQQQQQVQQQQNQQQQQQVQQQQQNQQQQQSQTQQHPQHHQSHEDQSLGEKERQWPCPSCKVPFKQASELQAHLSAHTKTEKTVPCDICGKYFASGDRVRIHVKAAHGEKSCSCEICGSGFSYRCKLLDHMRTHTGDKPFHCEVCGKSFSQKNHLTRHSMIHTGERPFPCDFCGRGFYRKDKLTRHRRIHTDHLRNHMIAKPFHCEVCGKSFSQRNHLTRHSMIHTGERPFPCEYCGKGFNRKDKLTKHRRIHTGERVTGQPRRRAAGQFNAKISPGAQRHAREIGHLAAAPGQSTASPANAPLMLLKPPNSVTNPSNAVKMEQQPMPESIPSSTATTTNLTFAPSTLTPTLTASISPSHYRNSPYKADWQTPPSGVH